jgi:hypothetical protein
MYNGNRLTNINARYQTNLDAPIRFDRLMRSIDAQSPASAIRGQSRVNDLPLHSVMGFHSFDDASAQHSEPLPKRLSRTICLRKMRREISVFY